MKNKAFLKKSLRSVKGNKRNFERLVEIVVILKQVAQRT